MQRSSFVSLLAALLAVGAVLARPEIACAQTSVMVLGVRSVEGDDEFTRNLTGALRHAASQVQGWNVSDREVTLAQMALAYGCDEPDSTCMAQIAESLGVDRVIYGDVRRTSAGDAYDWSINLHVFNSETDQIEHSVADTIPGVRRDIDDLRDPARRYMAALSGAPRAGTLHIAVNVPGAQVFIDGQSVGTADDEGHLDASDVMAGSRDVRIAAEGHQSFRSTVSVEPYGEASFEAELQAAAGGGGDEFPVELVTGVGLLVVAAGLAAGWIASWYHVRYDLNGDSGFLAFRTQAGDYLVAHNSGPIDPSQYDACAVGAQAEWNLYNGPASTEAARETGPRGRQVCSEASTFEALEFVFGIGAAAAAGVGLYLLIDALTGSSTPPSQQSWRLTPSFGLSHGYLGVAADF
jgi:hypothetical protein